MNTITKVLSATVLGFILLIPAQLSFANDQISDKKNAVYAKIILPAQSSNDPTAPKVESWISKSLNKRGVAKLRAVTQWIRIPEKGDDVIEAWDATIDDKNWGCPVTFSAVERTKDGKIKIEVLGFSPAAPDIKGRTLAAEIGSRRIALVNSGKVNEEGIAYIALLVGPIVARSDSNKN